MNRTFLAKYLFHLHETLWLIGVGVREIKWLSSRFTDFHCPAQEQLELSSFGRLALPQFQPLLTFLKKSASEPVRRGLPLPAWGSEVMAVVRLGEAVSRNCVLTPLEESQDRMGIRAMVRSLLRPVGESWLNWIQNVILIQMTLNFIDLNWKLVC